MPIALIARGARALIGKGGKGAGKLSGSEAAAGMGLNVRIDTAKLDAALQKFAAKADADVHDAVRLCAFKIERKVVERTPVDTGRARASWNISEEYANTSVQPEGEYGPPPPPVGKITGKKPVHISNNLEYIVPLEYGHSQQAPNGMAAIAVAEVLAELNTIIDGLG